MDDIGRGVVQALQRDGRAAFADIAAQLGVGTHAVDRRAPAAARRRHDRGRRGDRPAAAGLPTTSAAGIEVDPSATGAPAVGRRLAAIDEVICLARTGGSLQLLAEVVGTRDVHLLELVRRIGRPDGVRRVHAFLHTELVEETYTYGVA